MAWNLTGFTLNDWKALKGSQQRALIVTVVGAIVTACLAYEYGGTSRQSFISLTLSISLSLFMDRIARYTFENKTEEDLSTFVHKDKNLICLGSTEDGINWFVQHATGLSAVTNTVVNRTEFRINPIHREVVPRFLKTVTRLINGGCIWTDICLPTQQAGLEDFQRTLSGKGRENYEFRLVDPNVLILQCMTMKYRDGRKEVLFGWGMSGTDKSIVFHSNNRETTEYFEHYCQSLMSGNPYRPSAMTRETDSSGTVAAHPAP